MHWLHVRPNSDFPKNLHFFGRFLSFYRQIFCRFFLPKFKGRFGIRHTLGFFSPFCQFSADLQIPSDCLPDIWQCLGETQGEKKPFFGFWRRILAENSPKNSLKSAELSQNRNSASRVSNALKSAPAARVQEVHEVMTVMTRLISTTARKPSRSRYA